MTWGKWPGANFSPGPRSDVSGHGSSVQPDECLILFIFFYLYFMHTLCQIFVGLQDTKSTATVIKHFIKFLSCSLFYSLAFNKIIFFFCSAYQIKSAIKRFSCKSATHFFMSQQKWRTFCQQLCNIMSLNDGKQNKMSLIVSLRLMAVFLNACKAQRCSCSV